MSKQTKMRLGTSDNSSEKPNPKAYEKTMASWTRILGWSTIALVIATGISAYFLFETNRTIKKQVEAAGIQLRAYINFQQIIYIPHFNANQAVQNEIPPGVNVGVTWKNFGATPARDFSYWISAKWYPTGTEPDFSKPNDIVSDKSNITLSPGSEVATKAVLIPLADVQKLTVKNGRAFVWGRATYRDYIPESPERYFHFCMYSEFLPAAGQAIFTPYQPKCNYAN